MSLQQDVRDCESDLRIILPGWTDDDIAYMDICGLGDDEADGSGDVFGDEDWAELVHDFAEPFWVVPCFVLELGFDDRGFDQTHADSRWTKFAAGGFCEGVDGELCAAVHG